MTRKVIREIEKSVHVKGHWRVLPSGKKIWIKPFDKRPILTKKFEKVGRVSETAISSWWDGLTEEERLEFLKKAPNVPQYETVAGEGTFYIDDERIVEYEWHMLKRWHPQVATAIRKDYRLGKTKIKDKIDGGFADDMPDHLFDSEQIKKGIEIELEHTDDRALAKEISKDHLVEIPDYYDRLEEMEEEAEEVLETTYFHLTKDQIKKRLGILFGKILKQQATSKEKLEYQRLLYSQQWYGVHGKHK